MMCYLLQFKSNKSIVKSISRNLFFLRLKPNLPVSISYCNMVYFIGKDITKNMSCLDDAKLKLASTKIYKINNSCYSDKQVLPSSANLQQQY